MCFPEKTVYILGAGFSRPAGAPNQAEILSRIFSLDVEDPKIRGAQTRLRDFLQDDLSVSFSQIGNATLEDIYTPIDRCIADGTNLKSRTAEELRKIREDLGRLISAAISHDIAAHQRSTADANRYIHDFAQHIVKIASKRADLAKNRNSATEAKNYDPVSIISLNWDILLDNTLYKSLEEDCDKEGDYEPFGVVDYCCYVSSVEEGNSRIRSGLWSLGCRGYNVKLLKIHGSMNWLQCPNCQRLFVKFGGTGSKEDVLQRIGVENCRHCNRFGHTCRLSDSLVMPTFLKDLSNFQIKLIWQNTGVELMEAKHLVFIGYSLPHADFEFRQLLSRMVHRDATVEVVLFEGSSEEGKKRYSAEKERFEQFFGMRNITFHPGGVVEYVQRLVLSRTLLGLSRTATEGLRAAR
jgi:hypothetical protein